MLSRFVAHKTRPTYPKRITNTSLVRSDSRCTPDLISTHRKQYICGVLACTNSRHAMLLLLCGKARSQTFGNPCVGSTVVIVIPNRRALNSPDYTFKRLATFNQLYNNRTGNTKTLGRIRRIIW
jgi:hypothetical protein